MRIDSKQVRIPGDTPPGRAGYVVRNGIEYGLMAAYAEGFNSPRKAGIGNTVQDRGVAVGYRQARKLTALPKALLEAQPPPTPSTHTAEPIPMKLVFLVLLAAAHVTSAFATEAPTQPAPSLPDIERFVPQGWTPTQTVEGDINGDGRADLAAVLLRDDSGNGDMAVEPSRRGLLVLFADPAGGYRYQDFAREALPCATCLGALGGPLDAPAFQLAIADQELTVGWLQGSREMTKVKLIIGYDREGREMRLLRDESVTTDRLSGRSSRLVRDYQAGTMMTDDQESRLPSKVIPLTEVSADDY
jgi:hypothetical protein